MGVNQQHIIYSRADIENYLQGKMPKDAMHTLERNALQDSFLADAIEGYRFADSQTSTKNLADIEAKILSQKEDTKIGSFANKKNQWLKIAASIILILGAGWIGFLLMNNANEKAIVSNEKIKEIVKVEKSVMLADTNFQQNIIAKNKRRIEEKEVAMQPQSIAKNNVAKMLDSNKYLTATALDEVTVSVPYGRVKKSSLAGSVSIVTAKEITKQDTASIANVLDGKTAGIIATSEARLEQISTTTFASKKKIAKYNNIKLSKEDSSLVPVNGWAAFNDYLQRNNQSISQLDSVSSVVTITNTKTGEEIVGLEFEVDNTGTPNKIKVTKSVDKTTDAKAIELLKNGPKWINNNASQKGKIAIKIQ